LTHDTPSVHPRLASIAASRLILHLRDFLPWIGALLQKATARAIEL
jgi:hypothetical protein